MGKKNTTLQSIILLTNLSKKGALAPFETALAIFLPI